MGLTIPHMLSGLLEGSLKALFVIGENPMLSDPDVTHVEKALKGIPGDVELFKASTLSRE